MLAARMILTVVALLGVTGAQTPDYQARAKAIVSDLAARNFDKIEAQFDSTMSSVLPADKLTASWDQLISQVGKFKEITATRQQEVQGYHVVFVTCEFEKHPLDVKLAMNAQGQVAGLFFVPARIALPHRPQNPVKPYPYREEDVSYDNKSTGNRLAATLTLPSGKGPFPAVLLLTGSGPQDRDETVFGHKPFLVLSDYLTRKGIAVLRADDRGVGKSTGNFAAATTADFATDAEAGVAYLKTRSEINSRMIGLIGHSEGGDIAPMVAARNPDVAFIVMLAGSGVRGDEIIVEQVRKLSELSGASSSEVEKRVAQQRELLTLVEKGTDDPAVAKELREKLLEVVPEAQVGTAMQQINSPWYRYFLAYDPATALRKVSCPVLALNGSKDIQVAPEQNLPGIRKALEAAGNKHFEVEELPGLNHLFQTAKTGSLEEYAQIEETMSPVVLERVASWILKITARQQ